MDTNESAHQIKSNDTNLEETFFSNEIIYLSEKYLVFLA